MFYNFFFFCVSGDIADEIRKDGIPIIVVGIGDGTEIGELDHMAGGMGKAYNAKSFDELIANDFVTKLTHDACQTGRHRI